MERLPYQVYVNCGGTHLGGGWKLDRCYEEMDDAVARRDLLTESGMEVCVLKEGLKCG